MNFIRAEKISKSYGEKVLFSNLDFFIEEGNKVALIARNGSGKSSLLNCLAGIDYVDEGKISKAMQADLQSAVNSLIDLTYKNGAPDNVTVIAAEIGESPSSISPTSFGAAR